MHETFKLPDLVKQIGLSKSTIYLEIQRGNFPQPIKLSEKTRVWLKSDIEKWFASKINAREAAK